MKKLVIVVAIIMLSGFVSGQILQKENLVGTHTIKATLKPGVTMDQFLTAFTDNLIPIIKSAYHEWQVYLVSSRRGEVPKGTIGIIYLIKSEKDRDKYFNPDGSPNELGKAADDKINKGLETLCKLGTFETTYTDWIVL
jgi:hypothetical protein